MLKIGIIGGGFGQYGLFPAFNSIRRCEVVMYTDWQLCLENEKLDAVALAVTPRVQYTIAKAAINKGLHVFAEKPLAINLLQARELLLLAKKKNIIHGIDFMFPEIAEWKKVKALLDCETLGRLQHISVNWDFLSYDIKNKKLSWKTRVADGGGALSFFFSHGLYYLEHFAGNISDVKSLFTSSKESVNGGEVGVDMLLKFKNGITGYAHIRCDCRNFTRHQLLFQCERGTIVLENKNSVVDNFTITLHDQNGARQLKVRKDKGRKKEDERVKIVRKLATRFVNACIHNQPMYPSFSEGVRVQELIEKIRNSLI
ncbi:MAG: hypothetical protein A3H64_03540 [Candidatus Ryanbacteria bacterium RIFCSPLOWO2_02_FULL_45_11c]|uniref:Gfo/Idh/MocA-like oxidoreductase N-terminal domain-containing protein n=1 Tax=Candidatus Ryanbacteria bacterium RIFCSPLOWO2_02_FULL_45_11c TaxID=1802128 RepID=A0A1G2GYW9_9BACT|nr:MAG: hypothetical protein A3H64_03540 [Candidatus Ryanbacteria bacterium RIFCSPLOWO2_02_FULL_45_11c]